MASPLFFLPPFLLRRGGLRGWVDKVYPLFYEREGAIIRSMNLRYNSREWNK